MENQTDQMGEGKETLESIMTALQNQVVSVINQEVLADWHRRMTIKEAMQAIEALITERERLAIERYIQPHLDYCKEQNGMAVCKNCGLSYPNMIVKMRKDKKT